jgi:hypothetical protein
MTTIQTPAVQLNENTIILGFNNFGISGSEYIVKFKNDKVIATYNKLEMIDEFSLSEEMIDEIKDILK